MLAKCSISEAQDVSSVPLGTYVHGKLGAYLHSLVKLTRGTGTTTTTMARPTFQIRVVSFEKCSRADCPMNLEFPTLKDYHLVVNRREVQLEIGVAAAISYTWGEYDREKVTIGHLEDGCVSQIELGQEWWPRIDMMTKLASLTEECGSLWIDQLCIPQRGDALRDALAKISLVYETLEVRVLLPGSLCACLRDSLAQEEILDFLQNQEEGTPEFARIWAEKTEHLEGHGECVNRLGPCSYFDRLWTMSELRHTTRFRVSWCSTRVRKCIPPNYNQIQNPELGPYITNSIRRLLAEGVSKQEIEGTCCSPPAPGRAKPVTHLMNCLSNVGIGSTRFCSFDSSSNIPSLFRRQKDGALIQIISKIVH